jgi:gas vesicle protein
MLDHRKNRSAWLVAGIGLGALTGILFAPKSGPETRKAIAAGMDDGMERALALGRRARFHLSNVRWSARKSLIRKKKQVGAAMDAVKVFWTAA